MSEESKANDGLVMKQRAAIIAQVDNLIDSGWGAEEILDEAAIRGWPREVVMGRLVTAHFP